MEKKLAKALAILFLAAGMSMADMPNTVHTGFTVSTVNLGSVQSTMGVDFLSNGDMVWLTCQSSNDYFGGNSPTATATDAVYIVSNVLGTPAVRKVADMFRQPSGVVVANNRVYLSARDGFYEVPNLVNPANTATNRTLVINMPVNNAWHQWVFCPMFYNNRFYAPYSGTIVSGGPSDANPTSGNSGAFLSWAIDGAGGYTNYGGGLRSPNGGGMSPSGVFLVSDNQGSWLPSSTIALMRQNRFYGHRQNSGYTANWAQTAYLNGNLPYDPPVMWTFHGDLGRSPSQPMYLDKGPYAGDWIYGDINSTGLGRLALDNVNGSGNYQASSQFFTGGFVNGGVNPAPNRLKMHPTQNVILVGTIGHINGNWSRSIAQPFYRVDFPATNASFEILAIRSRANGVEFQFSQAINPATAVAGSFAIAQWRMQRQDGYGAGNNGETAPAIAAVQVSNDNMRVFLQIGNNAATDRLLRFTASGIRSASGGTLVFNQAWLAHNYQSTAAFNPGVVGIADRRGDAYLKGRITHSRPLPGNLQVKVDLPDAYAVSLRALNGSRLDERSGSGPSQFTFNAPSHGLYILQVKQAGRVYGEPVAL